MAAQRRIGFAGIAQFFERVAASAFEQTIARRLDRLSHHKRLVDESAQMFEHRPRIELRVAQHLLSGGHREAAGEYTGAAKYGALFSA